MEVMRNQEFVLLPTEHVIALLGNDDLNIPCEETILEAVLDWVKYDLSARKRHLGKLLAQVHFLSTTELNNSVEDYNSSRMSVVCLSPNLIMG